MREQTRDRLICDAPGNIFRRSFHIPPQPKPVSPSPLLPSLLSLSISLRCSRHPAMSYDTRTHAGTAGKIRLALVQLMEAQAAHGAELTRCKHTRFERQRQGGRLDGRARSEKPLLAHTWTQRKHVDRRRHLMLWRQSSCRCRRRRHMMMIACFLSFALSLAVGAGNSVWRWQWRPFAFLSSSLFHSLHPSIRQRTSSVGRSVRSH